MKKNILLIFFSLICLSGISQSFQMIPGKIEAESFVASESIGTEDTQDTGGGQNVGWIADGSWMDYRVSVLSEGYYTFNFRIANSYSSTATISLKTADGTILGQAVLQETGGMQSWQNKSLIVYLPVGNQTLRVFSEKGGFNLNWFEITGSRALPGKIQAEDYDVMFSVKREETTDLGGGLDVGYIDDGDWMDYVVNVAAAGAYNFNVRVANSYGNGLIEIKTSNGSVVGQIDVPQTGGWQNWTTVGTRLNLPSGSSVLRIQATRGAFNLNWLDAVAERGDQITAAMLPARIEAESYYTMNEVAKEVTSDVDGGENVGWIADGSWMDYRVNVPSTGQYTFKFRIANGSSPQATLALLDSNSALLGRIANLPQTGGMQEWKTVNLRASLQEGPQTLRVFAEKGGFNFNWFEVSGSRQLPGKIEAESFDLSSGVRVEPVIDNGDAIAVTYMQDNDWIDYNLNVDEAGLYTFNFRVAKGNGEGNIEIKTLDGAVIGSVRVPVTGVWPTWATIRTTANLSQGSQVLRIFVQSGGFNLNWFEVIKGSSQEQSVITFADLGVKSTGDNSFQLLATSNNGETPITFSSSNQNVVSVSNTNGGWTGTIISAGQVTITAMQEGSANFLPAANVDRTQVINLTSAETNPSASAKIPINSSRWYQLTNASTGLNGLFDGETQVNVLTGYGNVINNYEAYYPLLDGEEMTIEGLRFFDYTGSTKDAPMTVSVITDQWQRIPIASFTGETYNRWVGPYPGRQSSGDAEFKLDTPIGNIRYLVITISNVLPTEIEFFGTYKAATLAPVAGRTKNIKIRDLLGVNGYEWNFQDGVYTEKLVDAKMELAKSFTGLRHYMDWGKLESSEGIYSYNPTLSGSWNYDLIYEKCKEANIEVLACLKTLPGWMLDSYPATERDAENVPVRYGKDFTNPVSYLEQARVAFQYAARYGSNQNIDPALLSVSTTPRWFDDKPNTIKIGLNLIKYIECDNERDKWWKGRKGYQTAREYAANLSAFYDGHKNTMGPAIGVKNADPNMKVVIAGMVTNADYVKGMVDWCKEFRGYKSDGSVNLCWDIINIHIYTDNATSSQSGTSTRGAAPEVTDAAQRIQAFTKAAREISNDLPVWNTEAGYDIHPSSPLKSIAIGNKSIEQTQADWILRTSLFSARNGIEKLFFYQMYDDNPLAGMFGSSGFINDNLTRRPSADYFVQTSKLFGEYVYKETINLDPIVDRYELNGKSLFILTVPDEVGRTAQYTINLGGTGMAKICTPIAGASDMNVMELPIIDGKVSVTAGETPIFVFAGANATDRIAAVETNPVLASTSEKVYNNSLNVYPNPSHDYIMIDVVDFKNGPMEINIFDANIGQLHKHSLINKSDTSYLKKFNISTLPVGSYIIEIKQGNDHVFRRVVKGI